MAEEIEESDEWNMIAVCGGKHCLCLHVFLGTSCVVKCSTMVMK